MNESCKYKLSRGEICVANLIPSASSVSSLYVARTESFVSNGYSLERFNERNGELISPSKH